MPQPLRLCLCLLILLLTGFTGLAQTPDASLRSGLVAWFQLNEQAGTRALDASGAGRTATIQNGTAGTTLGHSGAGSTGLALTGTKALHIPLAWQPTHFTISWWVAPVTRDNWTQAVRANGWGSFLFHTSPNGTIYVGTDEPNRMATAAGVLELNNGTQPRWQLFTFTFAKEAAASATTGTGRLYKNGQLLATKAGMALPTAWTQLTIGSPDNASLAADGFYDDIRVYDRALAATEVAQLFTAAETVYTPPALGTQDAGWNWSYSRSLDGEGNVIGESKSFADALGRPVQGQVKSQTTGHVLATQTVYSSGGKPVLSTLAAPIDNREFSYKDKFVTANGADNYSAVHFEGANASAPIPLTAAGAGTLGNYYSGQNTLEPLTATTSYPFSLSQEYEGPIGGVKRSAGPGNAFRMGTGKQAKGREFPLLNELDEYLRLRPHYVGGTPTTTTLTMKGEKAVSVNVEGVESISFTDADGRTLATCLSGAQYAGLTVTAAVDANPENLAQRPQYLDLHIPAAGSVSVTVQGTGTMRILDLLTDALVGTYSAPWAAIPLGPGFYRVVSDTESQTLSYLARYGNFSYSYYDDAGRVVATIAPEGLHAQNFTPVNLAQNPSFDLDNAFIQGPSLWQTMGDADVVYAEENGGAHTGTYHGTHYRGGRAYYAFTHQVITNLPNGLYTFRAWVKGSGGQHKAYVLARQYEGNAGGMRYTTIPQTAGGPSGEWTLIELKDLPVSNGQCDIGFESDAAAGQFIFFDDVEFFNQGTGTPGFVTRNTYSAAGPLLATESVDEGRTEYVYARDGRIRFSQSALQKQQSRFSYSNYDPAGRVVESGEYVTNATQGQPVTFENQLAPTTTQEREAEAISQAYFGSHHPGFRGAGFIEHLSSVGRKVPFQYTVPTAGIYAVNIRYTAASNSATRTMSAYVNGVDVQQVQFPTTNTWTNWATQTIGVALAAGTNDFVLQMDADDSGHINVDYADLILDKVPAPTSVLAHLEDRTPSGGLDEAGRTQRNQVWYDMPETDAALSSWLGRTQEFVLGAVAKTSNGSSTTWYSYDEQGRVAWLVQKVPGLDKKTVDYTYDFLGNVLEVAYQKGQPDAFYHHYEHDADKRLRSVYTSPDGLAASRTLQARYFYYLHGPLKRVELADRLQGIDYTYTVQGWLKGINNVQKSLDPGQDNPTANGVLKDLFGLRLDYFDGDYSSSQHTAPNLSSAAPQHYDGTVRANTWHTAAAPTVQGYAYHYDPKGQLLQSDYGRLLGGTTLNDAAYQNGNAALKRFEEGNLSYDEHGNIKTLRRTDGTGGATDNFTYEYLPRTNKLRRTLNGNRQAVLSYEYDVNGQMTREAEAGQADKYLRYDVTGKVTGIFRNAALTQPLATYSYDDRGFRSSKVVYNAAYAATNTTYYVRDAAGNVLGTYEQAAGQGLQLTEIPLYGSSRLGTLTRVAAAGTSPTRFDARYELNDQLGNARVVFHRPTTTTFLATLEDAQRSDEEQAFANLPATRWSDPVRAYDGSQVARLTTAGEGPKKVLTVAKGDTVTFTAQAMYLQPVILPDDGPRPALQVVPLLGAAVPPTATPGVPGPDGQPAPRGLLYRLGVGVALKGLLSRSPQRLTGPPDQLSPDAQIRYRFYNAAHELLAEEIRETSGGPGSWEQLRLGYRVPEAGTLELTVLSTAYDRSVYFDHLEVAHTDGAIVQEQHQYAFGSPLTGLNYVVGDKRYRHGYQGKFTEKDEETGYDSFELRLYNSRIGRWTAPDPEGQFNSPYVGMSNNPVSDVDPDGGVSFGANGLIKSSYGLSSMNAGFVGMRTGSVGLSLGNISQAARSLGSAFTASGPPGKGKHNAPKASTASAVPLALGGGISASGGAAATTLMSVSAAAIGYGFAGLQFADWSINDLVNNKAMGMSGLLEAIGVSPAALYGPGYGAGAKPILLAKATRKSGKEKADDIPSWAKGEKPRVKPNGKLEKGKEFAERLMNDKYGVGEWVEGVAGEFNKLRKYGDRNGK